MASATKNVNKLIPNKANCLCLFRAENVIVHAYAIRNSRRQIHETEWNREREKKERQEENSLYIPKLFKLIGAGYAARARVKENFKDALSDRPTDNPGRKSIFSMVIWLSNACERQIRMGFPVCPSISLMIPRFLISIHVGMALVISKYWWVSLNISLKWVVSRTCMYVRSSSTRNKRFWKRTALGSITLINHSFPVLSRWFFTCPWRARKSLLEPWVKCAMIFHRIISSSSLNWKNAGWTIVVIIIIELDPNRR